jgi:hypothetical protein
VVHLVFCVVVGGLVRLLLPLNALGLKSSPQPSTEVQVLPETTRGPATLWFACDGSTSDIQGVLSRPGVISDLQDLKAGIALALPELSKERAGIVLELNHAGIPVTAWLALPGAEGYYLNASNAQLGMARFKQFERWSASYNLQWASIGLDIEPSIQDFEGLRQGHRWHLFVTIIGRYFNTGRIKRAKAVFAELISEMQKEGYKVDIYQFPFIADERHGHSTLLERITGIVDIRADREVLMLYTSFNPSLDSALIWIYGPEAQAIAVGSTQGSDTDPRFHPLNWNEFSRDLLVAHHFCTTIGVYNLEGCIQQGFLGRLKRMDWNQRVLIPVEAVQKAEQFRARVQRAIWIGSHLPYFALALLIVVALLVLAAVRKLKLRMSAGQMRQD